MVNSGSRQLAVEDLMATGTMESDRKRGAGLAAREALGQSQQE